MIYISAFAISLNSWFYFDDIVAVKLKTYIVGFILLQLIMVRHAHWYSIVCKVILKRS